MQDSYKQIQNENYQLRDYIINLQSRLIESQGDDAVPPPPAVFVHPAPPLMLVETSQAPSQIVTQQSVPVAVSMPTANMGADLVVAHKRTHEDTDQAFLQGIAQAAGISGGGYVQPLPPRKSSSPAAKRVKGEKELVVAPMPMVVVQSQKMGEGVGESVNGV